MGKSGTVGFITPEQGCSMNAKVMIEVDAKHEALVRRALAMAEEMEQLALTAPDGAVFDACEAAVIEKGRDLQGQMLGEAVARRIEAAEKKGRRSACARADGRRKTEGRKNAD
jgi:hypothetical protein